MAGYVEHLEATAAAIAERCTACGKCVEACPVAGELGLGDAAGITAEMRSLGGGGLDGNAGRWVDACNGTGQCLDACPEGLNVRQWVSIARLRRGADRPERHAQAAGRFRDMAQAIRLLTAMQLTPEERRRLDGRLPERQADVLFYTGCNVLRTPHLVFNVMDILDSLGTDYEILGGTANCCGVHQFRGGDDTTADHIAGKTYDRFRQVAKENVLTWCPTCHIQFSDTRQEFEAPEFDMAHVTEFLAARAEAIAGRVTRDMPRRAVLHTHGGLPGIHAAVRRLLGIIPGLELVEVVQDSDFGYACGAPTPGLEARHAAVHRTLAENASAAGVDLVVTVFHSCHRQVAGAGQQYGFAVKNYTDLLVEALGLPGRHDAYKEMKQGGDMDAILAAAQDYLRQNRVGIDAAGRDMLQTQIFGEPGIFGPDT